MLKDCRVPRHSFQDVDGTAMGLQAGRASELVTAVQDYTSTFVSAKVPDIFIKTSGQFPAVFVATKKGIWRP